MGKILLFLFFFAILRGEPLRVGMELSYPPFEMICHDGAPCGISVDMVMEWGKFLGEDVEIKNIPFIGLIPSLKNEMIDAIVSSLTITEQRSKVIAFSDPYVTTGLSLLLSRDSTVNNIGEANEEGKVIVVKSGTSGELYAKQHLDKTTIRVLDKESACVLEVIQGKADAFIYDQLSVYTNWKKNTSTTRVNLTPFQKEFWAFGVRKEDKELLNKVNQFLKAFRANGGFDRLAEKYLPLQKKAFAEMGVPFVF